MKGKRKTGIGIVGYGRFAEKWLRSAIHNSRQARLVAAQVRSRRVFLPGISVYSDIRDLLADPHVEAVYVTSPNHFHEEHVRRSLEAGKHVLCEKPMAVTPAEGRRMLAAARRSKRYLAVGHMLRFSPALQRAKRIIDHDELGRILYARADFSYRLDPALRSWAWTRSLAGGGALIDGGIHGLDSLRYLLGSPALAVRDGLMQPSSRRGVEKSAACTLTLPDGGFVQLTTHADAPYGSSLELIGLKGRLRLDGFVRCRGKVAFTQECERRKQTTSSHETISVRRVYEDQLDAFCVAARTRPQDLRSARNGLKNIEIIHALYQHHMEKGGSHAD